jgi:excisionase family DNA binding protein
MEEPLVGVKELEQRYGIPASWWYAHAAAGEIPNYKVGRYRKFRFSEVEKWLEQHRQGPLPVFG